MALFGKKKKDNNQQPPVPQARIPAPVSYQPEMHPVSGSDQPSGAGNMENDIFARVFSDDDRKRQQMVEEAMKNQPKSISENHKDFISEFDNLQIEQSIAMSNQATPIPQQSTERIENNMPEMPPETRVISESCDALVGISSVIGRRESQQDAAAVSNYDVGSSFNERWMAVLCDGMGGLSGGEQASAIGVQKLMESFGENRSEPIPEFYRSSFLDIDYAVANLKSPDGNYLGAGTTLISVIIDNGNLYWGSVGDSHIYIIRGSEMKRVNAEHNYFQELLEKVRKNEITMEEAKNDKSREALTSYMGIGELTLMDIIEKPLKLEKNDFIILCSDGLYRSVTDAEMFDIVTSNSGNMQEAATQLTDCALSKNKRYQDNTTVIVIRFN